MKLCSTKRTPFIQLISDNTHQISSCLNPSGAKRCTLTVLSVFRPRGENWQLLLQLGFLGSVTKPWTSWSSPNSMKSVSEGITLPETNSNFAPENGLNPKRRQSFSNHPLSEAKILVSGRVYSNYSSHFRIFWWEWWYRKRLVQDFGCSKMRTSQKLGGILSSTQLGLWNSAGEWEYSWVFVFLPEWLNYTVGNWYCIFNENLQYIDI